MMKKIAALSFLAGLSLSTSLLADNYAVAFEDIDDDHNGYISADEARSNRDLDRDFARVDLSGDGKLSIDEYMAWLNSGSVQPPEDGEVPELGAAINE